MAVRVLRKWEPPPGGAVDYAGPEVALREFQGPMFRSQSMYHWMMASPHRRATKPPNAR